MTAENYQAILEQLFDLGELDDSQLNQASSEIYKVKNIDVYLQSTFGVDPWCLSKVRAEENGWEFNRWQVTSQLLPLLKRFSSENIITFHCVPVQISNSILYVAFSQLDTLEMRAALKEVFPECDKLFLYFVPEVFLDECLETLPENDVGITKHLNALDLWSEGVVENGDISSTQFILDMVFRDAERKRVSDIHFVPEEMKLSVQFRCDGVLKEYRDFPLRHWGYLSARIKVLSGMNTAESRRPQSGRFTENLNGREFDIRVAAHPSTKGEIIVLRLLDKHKMVVSIDALGFCEKSLEMLKKMYTQAQGLVLLTGPTGSGKTTTLYSILNQLNQTIMNIMTLEDPVEYELPGIRQSAVHKNIMSFQEGIRAILRQDPDVILIGEIRDEETAKMAFRASQTGHLVFSTVHTNDVWGVFPRLMDFGVSFESIKQAVVGVVSQRLVRKVCSCQEVNSCPKCGGEGFYGRTVLAEMLRITPQMRPYLQLHDLGNVPKSILNKHYISLQQAASSVFDRGLSVLEEVQRYGIER